MTVLIDNYDSFTYNLVQYLGELGRRVTVIRNDQATVAEILGLRPDRIVISPGPGRPEQAGITIDLIGQAGPDTPILGVCLGHQAIGAAFGARVVLAPRPIHGKTSTVHHDGAALFAGVDRSFAAGRYHSLVVSDDGLPPSLIVTARAADDRAIMAVEHRHLPVYGLQFHPESVLTSCGRQILRNFVAMPRDARQARA
jgi:anthranilate synthase/aminodeoxychorismate synthase-like glutamine amidotransferase